MRATTCPECGRPAEVVDRFVLESTEGPVEHVQVRCITKHWFLLPTDNLEGPRRDDMDASVHSDGQTRRIRH